MTKQKTSLNFEKGGFSKTTDKHLILLKKTMKAKLTAIEKKLILEIRINAKEQQKVLNKMIISGQPTFSPKDLQTLNPLLFLMAEFAKCEPEQTKIED